MGLAIEILLHLISLGRHLFDFEFLRRLVTKVVRLETEMLALNTQLFEELLRNAIGRFRIGFYLNNLLLRILHQLGILDCNVELLKGAHSLGKIGNVGFATHFLGVEVGDVDENDGGSEDLVTLRILFGVFARW